MGRKGICPSSSLEILEMKTGLVLLGGKSPQNCKIQSSYSGPAGMGGQGVPRHTQCFALHLVKTKDSPEKFEVR